MSEEAPHRRQSDQTIMLRVKERAAETFIKHGPWAVQGAAILGAVLWFGWTFYKDQREERRENNTTVRTLVENNTRALDNNTNALKEFRVEIKELTGRVTNVESAVKELKPRN